MSYPEITQLIDFIESIAFHAVVRPKANRPAGHWKWLEVRFDKASFGLWVDDEFDDLEAGDQRLYCVLFLREIEFIRDSTDFLDWCREKGIHGRQSAISLLDYYKEMAGRLPGIEKHFKAGAVHSFISDFDFELNAGAAQALRRGD